MNNGYFLLTTAIAIDHARTNNVFKWSFQLWLFVLLKYIEINHVMGIVTMAAYYGFNIKPLTTFENMSTTYRKYLDLLVAIILY